MDYSVNPSAMYSYLSIFYKDIEEDIKKMYNPKFVVRKNNNEYSLIFLNDIVVIVMIKDSEVLRFCAIEYEVFIPDHLIEQMQFIKDLPPRLSRLSRQGPKHVREEMKECLIFNKIIGVENSIALWTDYSINIKIDDTLTLAKLLI